MLGVWQGSAAEQAEEMAPEGVKIVSGMHTVSAPILNNLGTEIDQDALLCGDDLEAKRKVARVLQEIDGLRCVDCGKLEQARNLEPLAALAISINANYRVHAGIRITGLPSGYWE
jgi:NADPH-dependent F420 reductase